MDHPGSRATIVRDNDTYHLLVDGKPFLVLGGQLAASTVSSAEFISGMWNKLADTGANTILVPVSWGLVERTEGIFDFSVVDALISQSEVNGLRVVLQWYGSLKGESTDNLSDHVPSWVKIDAKRFSRCKIRDDVIDDEGEVVGQTTRTIDAVSIFNAELARLERRAVATLAEHVRETDTSNVTIMLQIGGNIGFARDTRDCSPQGTAAFDADVPRKMIDYYHELGSAMPANGNLSWEQLGQDLEAGERLFSAYHFARYVNELALSLKKALDLPVFITIPVRRIVNGAPQTPGTVALWKRFAPCLDFWAPSVGDAPHHDVCETALNNDHPLLVVDHPRSQGRAEDVWTAFGSYGAIGVVVKDLERISSTPSQIPKTFKLLRHISPLLLDARSAQRNTIGINLSPANVTGLNAKGSVTATFHGLQVTIERLGEGYHGGGCGLVIEFPGSKFLLIGYGLQMKAKSTSPREIFTRVLEFVKKEVQAGGDPTLRSLRHFSGEETNSGRAARMPPVEPMIAEVEFYTLLE